MMRTLLFIFLTVFVTAVHAQTKPQVAPLNNTFKLKDGIYTSRIEFLTNNPAYPDYILKTKSHNQTVLFPEFKYYKKGNEGHEMNYTSPLFATVENGRLLLYYEKTLYHIYSKGTLCSFTVTKVTTNSAPATPTSPGGGASNTRVISNTYFLDIQNGTILKLNKDNLGLSIMRDSVLYKTFLKTKPGRKSKNLFKYISDFNTRNPSFLPIRDQAVIIKEEE